MIPSRTFEITKECEYPSDYVVIDFEKSAEEIDAQLRGLYPWASGFFKVNSFYFRVVNYKIKDFKHEFKCGTILKKGYKSLSVALKENKIIELF